MRVASAYDRVVPTSAALFAFDFVNVCPAPALVDFGDVRVFGVRADGRRDFVARPLVAPRVVVEPWLSPWFTLAAWVDADALYLPDAAVGLSIGWHFRAYDGGL